MGTTRHSIWVEIVEEATGKPVVKFFVGDEGTYEEALELTLNLKNDAIQRHQRRDIIRKLEEEYQITLTNEEKEYYFPPHKS